MNKCRSVRLARAMTTGDRQTTACRSEKSYVLWIHQHSTDSCSAERMPPQRHPTVEVGWPGERG